MSFKKVISYVAAAVAAFALSAVAYADPGKSPNGPPGPAGNPNQPQAQPQGNPPAGPQGNQQPASKGKSGQSHGKSGQSHGKSQVSHGKSQAAHGNSQGSHGESGESHGKSQETHPSKPNTNGKGGGQSNNFGKGKITICHATKSVHHPYVEITISVNGLHGHGPANDPRHHAGSWKDIIPAPADGCPGSVNTENTQAPTEQTNTQSTTTNESTTVTPPAPEVAAQGVLGEQVSGTAPASEVLGARASGGTAPKSGVLGAQASGNRAPAAAAATRSAHGSLPFTGTDVLFVLIAAAVALLGGFALRRALAGQTRA